MVPSVRKSGNPGWRWATGALFGACLLIAHACFLAQAWAQAGTVRAISGKAYAQDAAGVRTQLKVGMRFDAGMTFHTADDEHAELVLADGQVLIIGRKSRMRIDQFRFDSRNPQANALAISVLEGSLRFVGGTIATNQPDAVRVSAGASTVGLLGSESVDFTIVAETAVRQAGVLSVARGEVSLITPFGVIGKVVRDQVARWQPDLAPNAAPLNSLPAIFLAQISSVQWPESLAQAGTVRGVTGSVVAETPAGVRINLSIGTAFGEGTTFFTGSNESAELVLADGQVVLLGQKSIVRIDRFQFDRQFTDQPNTSVFGVTVMNGVMRFVGGIIASNQPESVRLTAGDTTIGIPRSGGTDFTLGVGIGAPEAGGLTVQNGTVTLTSPQGPVTSVSAGQGATWQPGNAPAVGPASSLPAAILAETLGLQTSAERTATQGTAVPTALAALPPTGAGADPAELQVPAVAPPVFTPGGGGGCVGSPC